jgi:hypothetical protein
MKARKYAFGGDVNASPDQAPPATYPFQSNTGAAGTSTTNNTSVGAQPNDLQQNVATTLGAFQKGGKVKGYAKGGSVKGSGCEQRGLRKCKVV